MERLQLQNFTFDAVGSTRATADFTVDGFGTSQVSMDFSVPKNMTVI